jgi:hypothetical protein
LARLPISDHLNVFNDFQRINIALEVSPMLKHEIQVPLEQIVSIQDAASTLQTPPVTTFSQLRTSTVNWFGSPP